MKPHFTMLLAILLIILTACDTSDGQDVIIEMEVTRLVTVVVTAVPDSSDTMTATPEAGPLPINSPVASPVGTEVAEATAEITAEVSPTPGPTATPDVFPTPIVGQILIAEQEFQNGKMFWLQPINQVWIATTNSEGEQIWINRDDNFVEGSIESDPLLTPPAEGLMQPIRGFGLLWRNDLELQNLLGWATNDEFGYTTNYEYHWGGTVDENNVFQADFGYHLVETLNRNVYRFNEADRTWEIIRQAE